ncbi:AsmA-like C-terminal region-containing protein [Hymenobacter busanensis]|uniref:AsmA-like C-terminal region-containing protein n=1 Tax=Hymenobacter busanensis TaxID=2607656 RepID=UPI0013677DA1|nr:AsmA-like C-terminal region-containing protein [Hymenobacter busanensis]QHJ08446.1 hypothetical protein GUY19_14595 [Hymenobacter busanensis]
MRALKWAKYVGLGLAVLLVGGAVALWLGQERIIGLFVAAANRHLCTPVQVARLDVSWWTAFPRVSVTLHQVRVGGSLRSDTAALARLQRIHCAFDAWDIASGRYRIRTLVLDGGAVHLRHDAHGQANYYIFRSDTTNAASPVTLALDRVQLKNVALVVADSALHHHYALQAHDLTAALAISTDTVHLAARGTAGVAGLRLGKDTYLARRELVVDGAVRYARKTHQLLLAPSRVQLGRAAYELSGAVGWAGATQLNLRVTGRQTDVQSLLVLLPRRLSRPLAAYRSRGEVYFGGTVQGELSATRSPRVAVQFGCRNAAFYHPGTRQTIEHVFLTGHFSNGAQATARAAVLELRDVRGTLRGRPFSGSLRYANFLDPTVQLRLRAALDVGDVLRFYPVAAIRQASGRARADIQWSGNLRAFRRNPGRAATQASGELVLEGVNAQLRTVAPPLTNLRGSFLLRRNDVAVTDFRGKIGASDFQLDGLLRNAVGWLTMPNQTVLVEADVASRALNLDELLAAQGVGKSRQAGRAPAAEYAFKLPADLALDLNASVEKLRFRRLRARDVRGTVRLQNQVLSTPGASLTAAGGRFEVRGSLDARQPALLQAHTVASCRRVLLDSLFYVFENFGQDFITARHLRGELTATTDAEVFFTPQLQPLANRLEAEVHATVRRGELNNFEPLQKLSMVASRDQLRHLRFDELTNTVYVQSGTVYVPEMEVRSNVRTASRLTVTGTHTFDQQMDYHLVVPLLPGLRRPVVRAADGALTTAQGPALLLHVWGDENNFRVGYDRQQASAKRSAPAAGEMSPATKPAGPATAGLPASVPRLRDVLKTPIKPAEKKPPTPQPGEAFEF